MPPARRTATRSHFDAQDYMESATPGVKSTPDGWLNRFLAKRSPGGCHAVPRRGLCRLHAAHHDGHRAVPLHAGPARLPPGGQRQPSRRAACNCWRTPLRRCTPPLPTGCFPAPRTRRLKPSPLCNAFRLASTSRKMARNIRADRWERALQQIAQLIKSGAGLEVAFAEVGGWDNHVNEGGVTGQLAGAPEGLRRFAGRVPPGHGRPHGGHHRADHVGVRPHRPRKRQSRHRPRPRQRHVCSGWTGKGWKGLRRVARASESINSTKGATWH